MKKILIVAFAVGALVAWYMRRKREDAGAIGTGEFPNPGKYSYDTDELNRGDMYAAQ